jgi:hypothetical protein
MSKLKAKLTGTIVHLPRYQNAEMLMLEFFKSQNVTITPMSGPGRGAMRIGINKPVDILEQLIDYINANLPED